MKAHLKFSCAGDLGDWRLSPCLSVKPSNIFAPLSWYPPPAVKDQFWASQTHADQFARGRVPDIGMATRFIVETLWKPNSQTPTLIGMRN